MRKLFCIYCGSFDFDEIKCCQQCGRPFNGSRYKTLYSWEALLHSDSVTVQIGKAPDGLPWVLQLAGTSPAQFKAKKKRLDDIMAYILSSSEESRWPETVKEAWKRLSMELEQYLPRQNVIELQTEQFYLSSSNIKYTPRLGTTMLSNVLPIVETLSTEPISTSSGASLLNEEDEDKDLSKKVSEREEMEIKRKEFQEKAAKPSRLAFGLNNGELLLLNPENVSRTRPFIFESFHCLENLFYQFNTSSSPGLPRGLREDFDDYQTKLYDIIRDSQIEISYIAKKQDLAALFRQLAQVLGADHRKGIIHGDLKPQNILLTDNGFLPIDSLGITSGEKAYALTTFWAPPEQILGGCLTPASDVYSLTKMLTLILGGLIYGEEAHYKIPSHANTLIGIKIMKDPYIYLKAELPGQMGRWQLAWEEFLRKGLAFNPDKRPSDGQVFADQLAELLQDYPVTDDIVFKPYWGKLILVQKDKDYYIPAWEIEK